MGLHGSMHQLRRMAVYDEFCSKKNAVLIATDVAARGLGKELLSSTAKISVPLGAKFLYCFSVVISHKSFLML